MLKMSPGSQTSQRGAPVYPGSDYLFLLLEVPPELVCHVRGLWGCCGLMSWGCLGLSGSLDFSFLSSGMVMRSPSGVEQHPLRKQKEKKHEWESGSARSRGNLFANSPSDGSWCLELFIPHILTLVSLFSSPAKEQRPGISHSQGGITFGPSLGEPLRTGRNWTVVVLTLVLLMDSWDRRKVREAARSFPNWRDPASKLMGLLAAEFKPQSNFSKQTSDHMAPLSHKAHTAPSRR